MIVDPRRLARAIHLDAVQVAPGRWIITGGRARHVVATDSSSARCECHDATMRRAVCKHRLAVALHRLPAPVRAALRLLVPRPRRARRRPQVAAP